MTHQLVQTCPTIGPWRRYGTGGPGRQHGHRFWIGRGSGQTSDPGPLWLGGGATSLMVPVSRWRSQHALALIQRKSPTLSEPTPCLAPVQLGSASRSRGRSAPAPWAGWTDQNSFDLDGVLGQSHSPVWGQPIWPDSTRSSISDPCRDRRACQSCAVFVGILAAWFGLALVSGSDGVANNGPPGPRDLRRLAPNAPQGVEGTGTWFGWGCS